MFFLYLGSYIIYTDKKVIMQKHNIQPGVAAMYIYIHTQSTPIGTSRLLRYSQMKKFKVNAVNGVI